MAKKKSSRICSRRLLCSRKKVSNQQSKISRAIIRACGWTWLALPILSPSDTFKAPEPEKTWAAIALDIRQRAGQKIREIINIPPTIYKHMHTHGKLTQIPIMSPVEPYPSNSTHIYSLHTQFTHPAAELRCTDRTGPLSWILSTIKLTQSSTHRRSPAAPNKSSTTPLITWLRTHYRHATIVWPPVSKFKSTQDPEKYDLKLKFSEKNRSDRYRRLTKTEVNKIFDLLTICLTLYGWDWLQS